MWEKGINNVRYGIKNVKKIRIIWENGMNNCVHLCLGHLVEALEFLWDSDTVPAEGHLG